MPTMRSPLPLCVLFPVLLMPAVALATAIDVELVSKGLKGQSEPAVVVKVNDPLRGMRLSLTRNDGVKVDKKVGRQKPDTTQRFDLGGSVGVWSFKGSLEVEFDNGSSGSMPLDITVEMAGPFLIDTSYEHLDLEKGEVQIQLNRAAGRCEHQVLIDGKPERHGETKFSGEPAGTWLTLAWRKHGDDDLVLRIRMKCWDAEETLYTDPLELFPWKLDIPHEDVNFESGKSDIMASEQPKLERSLEEITTALRRYGEFVAVKLYVVGHTDTVGDAAHNRGLSLERARSIGNWFSKHGVRSPIYYAGMGEDEQMVATPDNTPEAKNRRAEYIIGVEKPRTATWQRL